MFLKNKLVLAIISGFLFSSTAIFSKDKRPYWQQHVAYTIHVKLNDNNHSITADESVVYTNNSPDTLKEIYFHLWPNGYRNNRTPFARQRIMGGNKDFHDAKAIDKGYIDSLNFKADGKEMQVKYVDKSQEIARLILNTALLPGQSVTISTPFHVKIPQTFSRMGHTGQAYYISQWYPKPAVYDRNGWNTFPYLDQGEFYSEFGSFDVSITLPENYVLAATGRLQNASERDWLNQLAVKEGQVGAGEKDSIKSIEQLKIALAKNKISDEFPASSLKLKTLRYVQDSVHDFAWFADKRYLVEKTKVYLPSGREVECWGMYTPSQKPTWKGSANMVGKTIKFYSEQVGEYPYASATAVSGDLMPTAGGMEYPMVTIVSTKGGLEEVIVHEVGHNWFYGILGSQERQHPWMDEGINSFMEGQFSDIEQSIANYFETMHRGLKLTATPPGSSTMGTYILEARSGFDQPIDIPAAGYTQVNYGSMVYGKTAAVLKYLYVYLGKDEFTRVMHLYYDKWSFKHPMPEDIEEVFVKNANKDVSWFFGDMIKTEKRLDYAITRVYKDGNNYILAIKNKGGVQGPVFAAIGQKGTILKDTVIFNTSKKFEVTLRTGTKADYALINPFPLTPDVNLANNEYQLHPHLGTFRPPHFQALMGIERPDKTNILFIPAIGWNAQDKLMLGMGFSSDLLPPKPFSYQILPMYAFGSNMLAGLGRVAYDFYPYSVGMRHFVEIGVNGKQFSFDESINGRYTKIQPFISWEFQRKPIGGTLKHEIKLSSAFIMNSMDKNETLYPATDYPEKLMVNELKYTIKQGPAIRFFYADADFQNIQGSTNRLTAEMILRRPSPIKNQQLYFRLFAGTFLGNAPASARYNIQLGGIGGYQDFAYNNLYFDRTGRNGLWGQQIEPGAGGMKFISNSIAFSSNSWMVSSSFAATIPKVPFRVYVDGGAYQDSAKNIKMEYSAGISFSVLQDNIEVYFPIIYSQNLKTWMTGQHPGYLSQITFRINIKALDPKKIAGYVLGL